jgi:hypothetical protein
LAGAFHFAEQFWSTSMENVEKDKAPEIKVTEAMIEAGLAAYSKTAPFWDVDGDYLPSIVTAIYRAMLIEARR